MTPDPLPEDREALRELVGAALAERDRHKQRAETLEIDLLRLRQQLEWFRRRYYGPRADKLRSEAELAQMLLQFAETLEQKPVNPADIPAGPPLAQPESEMRRVKKRAGRRNLANFDNLPVRTVVYELSPEERACPGCGAERAEIGRQESWQLEFIPGHFERLQHLRKKYACAGCERHGENPEITIAAAPAAVVAGNQITRAGCMAHVRRKFVEAEKAAPAIAAEAVALIRLLYKVEAQTAGVAAGLRLQARRAQSVPVMGQLKARLLEWKQELVPKHPMAEAVGYALNQWNELNVFTGDGAVPIDNNASEREMKRVVLTRKNSLFVGNPRGGHTAAILASLVSTCRRHEIDPQLYLTQLLVNLPAWPMHDLAAWLPDQWKQRRVSLPPAPEGHP